MTTPDRRLRFTIPDDDDGRIHRVIDGLLSPSPDPQHPERGRKRPPIVSDPIGGLDSRLEWMAAFELEEGRRSRYGRPVGLCAVELTETVETEAAARLLAQVLRHESRDSDRIARVGPRRFHVLLPEAREGSARRYGERVRTAWGAVSEATDGMPPLRIGTAGSHQGEPLPHVLARAIAQLS